MVHELSSAAANTALSPFAPPAELNANVRESRFELCCHGEVVRSRPYDYSGGCLSLWDYPLDAPEAPPSFPKNFD